MKLRHPFPFALSAALAATLGLAGCQDAGDDSLADAPPVAEEPAGTLQPDATGTPEMPGDAAGPADTVGNYEPGLGDDTGPTALDITSVALGSEAGADDTIATPQETFAPDDDIVVAIDTDGAASDAQIAARLVYQDGQVAGEQSETITTTGADTTLVTFDNVEAWPAGDYTVEVLVNGTPAETAELTVQ
jgi:hypothetical protein